MGPVPQLKGCHAQAKSLDELKERMKEVVHLCLKADNQTEKVILNYESH